MICKNLTALLPEDILKDTNKFSITFNYLPLNKGMEKNVENGKSLQSGRRTGGHPTM